jgi:hypothetical protein
MYEIGNPKCECMIWIVCFVVYTVSIEPHLDADIETTDTYKKKETSSSLPDSHPAVLILCHAASNTSFARIT